ncbi:MAG TPA: hypothetical protein VGM50_21505 [Gemmatimonadaceae bacterium]
MFARSARAQGVIERFNLDKLEVTSLGVFAGHIVPSQLKPTNFVAIQADYGEIARSWRVVFNVSYWESRYKDEVIQQFVDTLQKGLSNPGDHITPSPIKVYDVSVGADVRYVPTYSGELKPFLGVGIAAHVLNAEGSFIKGTFVERALDDIATGLYATTGVSFKLFKHLGIEGAVRADLLSAYRSTQVRAGASYFFGHVRGAAAGGSGAGSSNDQGGDSGGSGK